MEYLDLYDIKGNNLHKTIARGDKNFKDGEYIKIATIWIKCEDKFLIQKASPEKGGEYAVSGGHVPTGHTSIDQACIELEEELGLKVDKDKLNMLGNVILKHVIFDVFEYTNNNLKTFGFKLQQSEVDSILWLTSDEIENLISQDNLRKSTATQYIELIKDR